MRTLIAALAVTLVAASPAAAQIMEMNGVWEYSPDKSIGPGPVQETLTFWISPGVQKYRMTAEQEDGSDSLTEWEIQYDGHDHPTRTPGTTASIRRTGDKTEFVVNKRDGRITSTYTRVLADDDQTIMSIGRNADGYIQWVRVFEKQ